MKIKKSESGQVGVVIFLVVLLIALVIFGFFDIRQTLYIPDYCVLNGYPYYDLVSEGNMFIKGDEVFVCYSLDGDTLFVSPK